MPKDLFHSAAHLHHSGRLAEAEKLYREVLQKNPHHAEALHNLGVIAFQTNQPRLAADLIRQALNIKPNYPEAYSSLGNALKATGQFTEAIAAFRQSLRLNPNLAEAHNNLGSALADANQFDEAVTHLRRAIELKPRLIEAHRNLARLLRAVGRREDALDAYRHALDSDPNLTEARTAIISLLAESQRFDEAAAAHVSLAQLHPNAPFTLQSLGEIHLYKREIPAAVESFRKAAAADPDFPDAWNCLGLSLQAQGNFDEAAQSFRRALELRPTAAYLFRNLINIKGHAFTTDDVQFLANLMNQPTLPIDDRINAGFALGKLLDDADRYEEAFAAFSNANALGKQRLADQGQRYDPEGFHRHIDTLIEIFTPDFFANRRTWGIDSDLPVFIVGMPRSGTTLIEQIAASHPNVHGAGEIKDISRIDFSLGGSTVESAAQSWTAPSIHHAAAAHLKHLQSLSPDSTHIVDKMHHNVLGLGLIAVLFPNARIIFSRRDPRDTALSCFFQLFSEPPVFSFDLAHCADQCKGIDRLMDHWLQTLPLRMLEVRYEEVVADQETQSRRLIDFLGLPWDPTCLDFQRAKNPVLTSSVWQVRQPIYTRSVGRWRNYQSHLPI
jgi:tetratricopeptide (TPR) repeat protein